MPIVSSGNNRRQIPHGDGRKQDSYDEKRVPYPDQGAAIGGNFCQRCGAWRGSLGLEPTPELYIQHLIQIFREVRRVLRDDGTLWVNIGDSYAGSWGNYHPNSPPGKHGQRLKNTARWNRPAYGDQTFLPPTANVIGLKPKDLVGTPWMLAFALRADGWWLRSDIIWCLSGGAWVYVKVQKGIRVCMVRELMRLDPATVQLWNGTKWVQMLGISKNRRSGDELEITLRSGERIACTPTHKWPTSRGLLAASELVPGDVLKTAALPEPEACRDCAIDDDAAWFAGLYIAEGSRSGHTIQIAGHKKEEARWQRLQRVARKFGGYITRTVEGNSMNIRMYGKVLFALLDELVSGHVAKDKCFSPIVWNYSNGFLAAMVDGYLAGDGHWDEKNKRWQLGFTRNYNLERDLRCACARLGYTLALKLAAVPYNGALSKTFRGELRKERSGHWNERDMGEVVSIGRAKCREVYDLGVAEEPHLFALASGILTHNSKPNPMPESVTDRPTKAHEYVFLLTKSARYHYDADAVREPHTDPNRIPGNKSCFYYDRDPKYSGGRKMRPTDEQSFHPIGRNKRTVWTVATEPYPEAHFAVYPRELIRPCIRAGTSERGCCPECGAPWERVVEKKRRTDGRENIGIRHGSGYAVARLDHRGKAPSGLLVDAKTIGWRPTCSCEAGGPIPCIILDPFAGTSTTGVVAIEEGCNYIGIEPSEKYAELSRARLERAVREHQPRLL